MLFRGRLARASIWLFTANLATGIFGYAYQIIMGRMLTPADYGLLSALVALGVILPVPLGAGIMILTRKFAEYSAHGDGGRITDLWNVSRRWINYGGAIFLLLFLMLAAEISDYLGVPSKGLLWLLGAWVLVYFFIVPDSALLQGMQAFGWYGGGTAVATAVKIVASIGLVWAGYGIYGALWALLVAGVVMWGLFSYGARAFRLVPPAPGRHRFLLRDTLPIVAATAAFTIMTQLDVVLVRHYFGPHEAGVYAAAAALGKAVMYLPGAIAIALFPMVAENDAKSVGSAPLLIQAVLLVGVLSGSGALIFVFFPDFLIHLLYGRAYEGAVEVLRYFGFAMLPMALVMVAEHFLIAKGRVLFVYLFAIIAPLQIVAVYFFHETLFDIVKVLIACGTLLMVLGYSVLWREYRKGVPPVRR